jgi:copper homeostasis protein
MELEICVDSVESAIAAEAGGADRVELCSAISEGGLTPSIGMMRAVRARIEIGMFVMIRPRGGDFVYSPEELNSMRDDIACAAGEGADGVVLGLLTPEGSVDVENTGLLATLAAPMQVTFHRALDMTRDLGVALEDVVRTGAHRVLTSGGANTALHGSKRTASLVRAAGRRIRIMVCGQIRPSNVGEVAALTGAREFHASLRKPVSGPMLYRNTVIQLGDDHQDDYARFRTFSEDVRQLREALDAIHV